jgi:hypothetical protein
MVMVLDTVGLPAEDVTIILAVDWLLDRSDSKKGRGNNANRGREGITSTQKVGNFSHGENLKK